MGRSEGPDDRATKAFGMTVWTLFEESLCCLGGQPPSHSLQVSRTSQMKGLPGEREGSFHLSPLGNWPLGVRGVLQSSSKQHSAIIVGMGVV